MNYLFSLFSFALLRSYYHYQLVYSIGNANRLAFDRYPPKGPCSLKQHKV